MKLLQLFIGFSLSFFLSTAEAKAILVDSLESPDYALIMPKGNGFFDPTINDYGKNIIKINLTSLAMRNISLQYERVLNHRFTAAIGVRFMPSGNVPLMSYVQNAVSSTGTDTLDENAQNGINSFYMNTRMSGFAITPEFRIYFSKIAGKGFYVAPFLRYEQLGLKTVFNYSSDDGTYYNINFSGSYSGIGGGVLIGAQFNLGKRVVFDWWILGPYLSSGKLNLDASGFTIADEDYDDFIDTFNDVEVTFLGYKIEKTASKTAAHVGISGAMFGLRSFGFTFGIRL